ncbi:MAG: quinone-dependent dihydroorotate dehydrogenase [Chitinophagaceae bacterium]|nr:quinone-dependent dihydroorotate dehydrogenase [Chitinophagaceae bacterium]
MYSFLRKILFLFPPESVHYFSMNMLKLLCAVPPFRWMIKKSFTPNRSGLSTTFLGLTFRNPVGLGAGFDKNARYLRELEALGFGYVEIGTVTPLPQAGNDKPRLFRLPSDQALINRMGFNNDGVATVVNRLKKWRASNKNPGIVVGGNIGKNKITANEDAWKDYEICFKELHPWVDYFVVNVSSPNTPGLRALQEKESLRKILMHLQMINNGKAQPKPILLKIAPDLNKAEIDDVIDLALEIKLDGLVATNTTISRENLQTPASTIEAIGAGGLSGAPVKNRSTEVVRYIQGRAGTQIPVIASGGIFTGDDAREKLHSGASLVQVWTGFIYVGPGIVKQICQDLPTHG